GFRPGTSPPPVSIPITPFFAFTLIPFVFYEYMALASKGRAPQEVVPLKLLGTALGEARRINATRMSA
ncbi:MAG: hypothetical protein WBQ74_08245, partial [Candidatus Sulfotelmatobacter sp.]